MTNPTPSAEKPPTIPTGKELYDALMSHIEPELTSEGSKGLDVKYTDESAEDKARRMQRYELAFERYEQSYREYMDTLDAQVVRYRREAFSRSELQDRAEEQGILEKFPALFEQAA